MSGLVALLSKDWFLGFLSGVAATLLGFLLTLVWDIWKIRREATQRDQAISKAITEDLASNKRAIDRSVAALHEEIRLLGENRTIVHPLQLMKTGFWQVAIINPPAGIISHQLPRLRNIVASAEQANDQMRSRENYRLQNEAMSNFGHRMRLYDEMLLITLNELRAAISTYEEEAPPGND